MKLALQAKQRLLADEGATSAAETNNSAKEGIDRAIDNKKAQVKNLKRSVPSRENRMAVSPEQRNRTEKQIHQTQEETSDLRLKKSKIGT